jgi:YaiO family outer membrane protein
VAQDSIHSGQVISRNEVYINAENRYFLMFEYGRKIKENDLLFRINSLFRSGEKGLQYELDYYPKFSEKSYGYFSIAYSGFFMFPTVRTAGEYYQSFSERWEYSIGVRTIHPENYNIYALTGTLGMYPGNWFIYFRPTLSILEDGVSTNGMVAARWYWGEYNSFYELVLIRGVDTGTVRDFNAIENSFGLETYVIRGKVRYKYNQNWEFNFGIDYSGIYIPQRNDYIIIVGTDIAIRRFF